MKMTRLNIQLPVSLKAKLDSVRSQGISAAGLIRTSLEPTFQPAPHRQKGTVSHEAACSIKSAMAGLEQSHLSRAGAVMSR